MTYVQAFLFIFLVCLCDASNHVLKEYPDFKVCVVRNITCHGFPVQESLLRHLILLYKGCTHVVGNLILCNLLPMPDGSDPDLSFLRQIREVTGYVHIKGNKIKRISLPSLRVIRGVMAYEVKNQKTSLYIADNIVDTYNGMNIIDLRNLTAIQRHDVIISNSPLLCHLQRTIDWAEIFTDPSKQTFKVLNDGDDLCKVGKNRVTCSASCPDTNSTSFCWGPEDGMCQRLPKCPGDLKQYCVDGHLPKENCHEECLGGCDGRRDNCRACKNVMNAGQCKPSCPAKEIVHPGTSRTYPNPDFKYNFHDFCIKDCPSPFLKSNTHCVIECQLTHQMPKDGTCVECLKTGCAENCNATYVYGTGRTPQILDAVALAKLKNCVYYTGRLMIVPNFSFKSSKHPITDINQLWNLKNLRGIVGYIQFNLVDAPSTLTNLSFLENLEFVTFEAAQNEEKYGIAIMGNPHIELLGFRSLTSLDYPVKLMNLPSLCYRSALDSIATVELVNVISEAKCEIQGHVCHSECLPQAGCWGPGSDMCGHCCHRRAGSHCVSQCTDQPGYYDPSPQRMPPAEVGLAPAVGLSARVCPTLPAAELDSRLPAEQCAVCHEECAETCYGPKANECTGACKNYQLGDTCVPVCPANTYANEATKQCLPCHVTCQPAARFCSGPGNFIGKGGCTTCLTVFQNTTTTKHQCLRNDCPARHFMKTDTLRDFIREEGIEVTADTEAVADLTEASTIVRVCKPCHPFCEECSGSGTHNTSCKHCLHWWYQSQCVKSCPPAETYLPGNTTIATTTTTAAAAAVDTGNATHPEATEVAEPSPGQRFCLPCHRECVQGCSGPGSEDCVKCHHFKVVLDEETGKFNCTTECPESQPEELHGTCYTREEYAVRSGQQARRLRDRIFIGVATAVILVILIIAPILIIWLKRKAEKERSRVKLFSAYTNLGDPDTLDAVKKNQLLSREPNMGRLEMISADDLEFDNLSGPLGSGAFGVVYRGLWRVPKAALMKHGCHGDTKLDVAIKVIQNELPFSPGFLNQSPSNNNTETFRDPEEEAKRATARANIEELLQEAKVMASVEYMYCLPLIGVCLSRERQCLVSAFVELGSLDRYVVRNRKELNSLTMLTWAAQIADGMSYLEMRGIIHRDLAARNVLVQERDLVQITDFGLAKMLERRDQESVVVQVGRVPIRWLAIETLQDSIYSHKTDVWSYGVTLWEIFTYGRRPYEDVETKNIKDHVMKGGRLTQPEICTLDVYMVMVKCWMEDIESRPTFAELNRTFKKFCKTPGSYLYIQGDVYAVKYPNNQFPGYTPDVHELQPLLPSPSTNAGLHRGIPDGSAMPVKENGVFFHHEASPPHFIDSSGGTNRDPVAQGGQFTSDNTATTTVDYMQPGFNRHGAVGSGDLNGNDLLPVRHEPTPSPWALHRHFRAGTSPTAAKATSPTVPRPKAPLATREHSWQTEPAGSAACPPASSGWLATSGLTEDEGYLEPNRSGGGATGPYANSSNPNPAGVGTKTPVVISQLPSGEEGDEYLTPKPSAVHHPVPGALSKHGDSFGVTNMEYFMQPYFPGNQMSTEMPDPPKDDQSQLTTGATSSDNHVNDQ